MIVELAIRGMHIWTLDDSGVVRRMHALHTDRTETIATPATVDTLDTSPGFTYIRTTGGDWYRRHANSWHALVDFPALSFDMAANHQYVYALNPTGVFFSHQLKAQSWIQTPSDIAIGTPVYIDASREFLGLVDALGDVYVRKIGYAKWTEIPTPFTAQRIAIGKKYIVAIDSSGDVWRSRVENRHGWTNVTQLSGSVAIAYSPNDDQSFYATDGTVIRKYALDGEAEVLHGWVVADWVTEDWVAVGT